MPFVSCPKCGASVTLPDRSVSKTCCVRCKTVFPVRPAAPPVPKQSPGAADWARPPKDQSAAVPEDQRGSGALAGTKLWLAVLVPVLALGGFGLGWWMNRKPEPAAVAANAPEEVKPVVNEAPAPVEAPVAAAPEAAAKAEAERLAREKADREARAEQEAKARADKEKAEQARRAQEEEDRLTDLWKRHGKNFVFANGKFVRLPPLIEAAAWGNPPVGMYGKVSSVKIVKIKGPDEMIVRPSYVAMTGTIGGLTNNLRYVSRLGPTIYLKGYATQGLVDDKAWEGPAGNGISLAIIGTTQAGLIGGGSKTVFLAVPVEKTKEGLSREEFRQLVKQEKDLGPDRLAELRRAEEVRARKAGPEGIRAELDKVRSDKQKSLDAVKDFEKQRRLGRITRQHMDQAIKGERDKIAKLEARENELLKQLPQEPKPPKPKPVNPEEDAALKLKLAKAMLRDADDARAKGDTALASTLKDKARTRLKEIIDKHPDTAAGKDAKELLGKLNG